MAKHNDGIMALTYAMAAPCVRAAKELDTAMEEAKACYDRKFWGAADCTNTACPYHTEDGPMKCDASEVCPGQESEAPR